ncbi:hypothetical protein, variant [Verruconis gallopava]|uniref:BTB domain-containing protein n=1 Tax=Verruconis gallopava TaxID=253628 RepID=A0A0D2AYS8_9PEZI|nr:uncharacterized protein PV09_04616 [Verruconis gallopava]XP_016214194.1 hypothetical protein, variant [Verruconis gallopava]KIW04324.1 hypothetical protein PV09_04616 [Verruconis gallopava]KIW04325.1 hypothetical protein, variant [Verruconis gallopava]
MNIRDSESSTDDELPEPAYGSLRRSNPVPSTSTEAPASGGEVLTTPTAAASTSDTSTLRSSIPPVSSYASPEYSVFSTQSAISRPASPPSPLQYSNRSSSVHEDSPDPMDASRSATSSRTALSFNTATPVLGDVALTAVEKDGDDPTLPLGERLRYNRHATPTALTRLLASRILDSSEPSRESSYIDGNPNLTRQISSSGSSSLHEHLYRRGLLEGKHSDIAIIAFGHKYNLHKLVLDRAPFFTTALSEPWLESQSREIILHPEDVDPTITRKAFELALKSLYGCSIRDEEDAEAIGLFTTGCWLDMSDLVSSASESILRQMGPETLSPLIRLVTNNYYGRAGDRILSSAKAMLCRDGWEMPLKYWDDIPGEIVRDIVGGDGFYVYGEWDRWVLAKRLLDRRLRQKAVEYGLVPPGSRASLLQAPEMLRRSVGRQVGAGYTCNVSMENTASGSDAATQDIWTAIYTDPDIEPLLVLLDHGIHYVHLDFERLQYIRQARDVFGLPVLPEHIVNEALWMQMELRQRVLNARESDLELGLSQAAETTDLPTKAQIQTPGAATSSSSTTTTSAKGKQKIGNVESATENDTIAGDANQPRKFWIPSADCTIVIGGNAEPVITTSSSNHYFQLSSSLPTGVDVSDVLWASNFAGPSPSRTKERGSSGQEPCDPVNHPRPVAYSKFPPFRFAVEFPNPRGLKEKKRVYSRTVSYAGSNWNIYIQKVRSQKNPQLGVYLHRAKGRDTEDYSSTRQSISNSSTVDERIGLLEREVLLRSSDVHRTTGSRSTLTRHSDRSFSDETDDGSMASYRRRVFGSGEGTILDTSWTAFDSDSESDDYSPSTTLVDHNGNSACRNGGNFFEEQAATSSTSSAVPNLTHLTHFPPPTQSNASRQRSVLAKASHFQAKRTPTVPPYTDTRPTIKTYFKIYSPSKGGRLLSVYESAPDKFDFSQSWGWKSSTLMLDEGFSSRSGPEGMEAPSLNIAQTDNAGETTSASQQGGLDRDAERERERRKRNEGVLRFMVVIGNL